MSADAKVWQDDEGDWRAVHDGDCALREHRATAYDLPVVLAEVEACMGHKHFHMRWMLCVDKDGQPGLKGYTW